MKPGNKINAFLNKEWGKHARAYGKLLAGKRRRKCSRIIIRSELKDRNDEDLPRNQDVIT